METSDDDSYSVRFEYVFPSGQTIEIQAEASLSEENLITDLTLQFFNLDGELMDVNFNREAFEQVEDEAIAHLTGMFVDNVPVDSYMRLPLEASNEID